MDTKDQELQNMKAQLVLLAEFLQTALTDAQVVLYASELADLGAEGLRKAIVALKADPTLWPGKFPLPAKIRSYLIGDINLIVASSVDSILACNSAREIYSLPRLAYEAAQAYGIKAIVERDSSQTGTLYAQLRDAMKAKLLKATVEGRFGLTGDRRQVGDEGRRGLEDQSPHGTGGELEAGQDSPSGVRWGSEGIPAGG